MKNIWIVALVGVWACAPENSGSSEPEGADDPAETAPATPEATQHALLSGKVTLGAQGDEESPVDGARVELAGTGIETLTDVNGRLELQAPVGRQTLVVRHDGHWGAAIVLDVPAAGLELEDDVNVIPPEIVDQVYAALGQDVDPAAGALFVDFETEYEGGGESVQLNVSHGAAFTFVDDAPVSSNTLVPDGESFVGFTNVPAGSVKIDAIGAPGNSACDLYPTAVEKWPVFAGVMTQVEARCADLRRR